MTIYPWRAETPAELSAERGPAAPEAPRKRLLETRFDQRSAAPPDAVRLRPNLRLEGTPYEIVQWLGDGGMGVVFEARHLDLDRRVALKVLRSVDVGPVSDLFRQEARLLAKLGSDYVVQIFDFFQLRDGRLVIAMELVEGVMLSEELEGPMDPVRALPILRQTCKGLAAVHGEGVVHRDLKPANVALLRRKGRADSVKLLDFGVAQFVSARSSSRAGTPGYVAPEVLTGLRGDNRADLYAFGALAYLVLAGRMPFEYDDVEKLVEAHITTEPPPPSQFAAVPRELEDVVMRCLAKAPMERFADAQDLEAALCEAQIALGLHTAWDDLPLPDVDPTRRDRLLREMPDVDGAARRRRRLPWLLGALGFVSTAALATVVLDSSPQVEAQQTAEVRELAHQARAAAAKAFFVYPPPEQPREPTAFAVVGVLEARGELGDAAQEQATALRLEFADTLERLGDQYWAQDGGRPFAIDYYAQAVVFDPERERSRERAAMTPGELVSLRQKAQTQDFSQLELEAAEPLLVLAQADNGQSDARLERLRSADSERAESTQARLRKLTRGRKSPERAPAKAPAPAPSAPASEPELAPAETIEGLRPKALKLAEDAKELGNDIGRGVARRLTKAGDKARRSGDSRGAEAHYAKALEADRRYAPAYAGLARIHYDAGSYALAARTAAKAVRMGPRNGEYRILLGDAQYKSYAKAAARNSYKRAGELGHPQAEARLRKLGTP